MSRQLKQERPKYVFEELLNPFVATVAVCSDDIGDEKSFLLQLAVVVRVDRREPHLHEDLVNQFLTMKN